MLARINDAEIYYTINGTGPPLLLMHGGMGLDHTCFRPWFDPLADRFQLIYYDHRGNGRSTLLDNFNGIDHTTWADDADALRRHLGHEKIVLFGHSCGGFVAMEYARRYADHLAGLVLCCTAPALDYPDVAMANAQRRSTQEQYRQVIKTFSEPYRSDEEFKKGVAIILPVYFKRYDSQIGEALLNSTRFSAAAMRHSVFAWFPAFNSLSWLNQISVPTLIVAGGEDWITPPVQGAARLHSGIPNSEIVIFEDSGHFPFIEEQERFIKTIGDWVARLK